jgi:predicted nuclease with TOPRIM domain
MNTQPETNSEQFPENSVPQKAPEVNYQRLHDLPQEVERIYLDLDQLRKLWQTLVTGLIIAIFLALGISLWFAYRLLLQEKIARQKTQEDATTKAELIEQIEELQRQVQLQDQQLTRIRQQIPENITDSLQQNQTEINKLSDRLDKLENP